MATVNSGGVDIVYDVLNPGSPKIPIFFIAGLNGMRNACMKQAMPFSQERTVVLHDHRGTGASAKTLGIYSVENMADDVVAIMDDAGIAKAHIVGTSLGGAIGQALCVNHPTRVQSAGIICSFVRADPFIRRQFEMRKRILQTMGTEALMFTTSTTLNDPDYFADHFDQILEREKVLMANASPIEVDLERIDAIFKFDLSARLGQIRTPVTVMGARNDVVCPPRHSERLAAAIPGAELKLYDNGGHFFYLVHAERFNADIRDFITRHE